MEMIAFYFPNPFQPVVLTALRQSTVRYIEIVRPFQPVKWNGKLNVSYHFP